MSKINWAQKLTSRKFWLALAGLVVGVLALLGTDANTAQQVSGVIMALGSVVAYIVGEGLVDAASAGAAATNANATTASADGRGVTGK
jgi:drug/metabolite transporter (DMT)-like permease